MSSYIFRMSNILEIYDDIFPSRMIMYIVLIVALFEFKLVQLIIPVRF